MPPGCQTEYHTCESFDTQYLCSPGYCFITPISPNAGIPPSGVVVGQTIEIDGDYQISQSATFVNCHFKMRGGARITVAPMSSGIVSVTFDNCYFFSCAQLWYGIAVNASGTSELDFTFKNCSMEDAYQGLLLDEGALNRYFIKDNVFFNNHLGITNRQQNGTPLNAMILKNKFYSTDDLAQIPANMSTVSMPFYPLSYAGIEFIETIASVGRGPDDQNEFYCMLFGLMNNLGAVRSSNNSYYDINQTGNGIWVYNGTQVSMGDSFHSAGNIALLARASNLLVAVNHFDGRSETGIQSENNLNAEIVEIWRHNVFDISEDSWRNGVKLNRSHAVGAGYHNRIAYNRFNVSGNAKSVYPVMVSDLVSATDELHITGNRINVNQNAGTVYGIWTTVSGSDGIKIRDNQIGYSNPEPFGSFGIFLQGAGLSSNTSANHTLSRNVITGQSADALQCCIHTLRVQNMEFCENTVDYSRWGLHFVGQSALALRENKIRHHQIGVYIGTSGGGDHRIGQQSGRGNTWSDQTLDPNDCTLFSARVENGSIPENSQFLVHESSAMPFLPPGGKIFPNTMPMWLRYDPSVNEDYCIPSEGSPLPPVQLTPFEVELIEGASVLTGTALWDLQRRTYLKLLLHPGLRPAGSAAEVFFNSLAGTPIAAFGSVQEQINTALALSASDQQLLDGYRQAMNQALDSLHLLDSLTAISAAQGFSTAYYNGRAALLQQVADNKADENATTTARNQQVSAGLQTALAMNNAIITNTIWEAARKTLNEIYIRSLLAEPLTQGRYQQILNLAGAIPEDAGEATQDAILFLGPCDQDRFLVNESDIEAQKAAQASAVDVLPNVKVRPNPTNGEVFADLPVNFTGKLVVFNYTGKVIAIVTVIEPVNIIPLHLNGQPSGLYWVTAYDSNGTQVSSARISLVK